MAMQPEFFSAWVKWHGPYRNTDEWITNARALESKGTIFDRTRLYMAIGRSKLISFRKSQVQYVGLNSRDSSHTLSAEINDAVQRKVFRGIFNEYWLGELLTQFLDEDTQTFGLTRFAEKAIIYALDPVQNLEDHLSPPAFSFRIMNSQCDEHERRTIFPTRFERLMPNYLEFDAKKGRLVAGRMTIREISRQVKPHDNRWSQERKRKEIKDWWRQRFNQEEIKPAPPTGLVRNPPLENDPPYLVIGEGL